MYTPPFIHPTTLGPQDNGIGIPRTDAALWADLTIEEQAAARYGLGYDEDSWNKEGEEEESSYGGFVMAKEDDVESTGSSSSSSSSSSSPSSSSKVPTTPQHEGGLASSSSLSWSSSSSGVGARVSSFLSSVGRSAVPVLQSVLRNSRDPRARGAAEALGFVHSLADTLKDPVAIQGQENLIYLDDSGSMYGPGLLAGQAALQDILPTLKGMTSRVLKFGSSKTLITDRTHEPISGTMVSALWDASSGGTYMW